MSDILHIKSSSIAYNAATTDTTSTLAITLPEATLTNGQVFTVDLCQSMPSITAGDNPQVVFIIGTTTYSAYLQMGNYIRANGLKCRRRLTLVYGTDPVHMTILSPCLR